MQPDGTYVQKLDVAEAGSAKSSQDTFIELAQKRKTAAAKHRQSKLRAKLLTYFHKRVLDENEN